MRVVEGRVKLVNGVPQRKRAELNLTKFCFRIRSMVKGHLLFGSVDPSKDIVPGVVAPQYDVVVEDVNLPLAICQADAMDDASYDWELFPLV